MTEKVDRAYGPNAAHAEERKQCEAWETTRSDVSSRFDHSHRCPHPARFRIQPVDTRRSLLEGEYVCGRHVRPALMDNGDSVAKSWIVTRLDAIADPTQGRP